MDFSAYPHLIKYLPNWLERLYPRLAQFARGEGYPCGNKGVFIPRRNRCWTHPKTGTRLKKPLTYQMYKTAKEKSQKSRTEKGRTALANREQSFRDKAREKVKGWQNKKVEAKPTPANEAKMRDNLKKVIAGDKLSRDLAESAYQTYHYHQNGMKREAEGGSSRSIASLYQIPHATAVARINGLREAVGLGSSNAVSVDKELGERINDLLNDGKQIKINSRGGGLKDQKKEPSQTTIDADKKWSDFLESKNVTEKGLRKLDPETRKKITEEFENSRIEERAKELSKRKGLSLPEEPKQTPNSSGESGKAIAKSEPKPIPRPKTGTKEYDDWLGVQADELKGEKSTFNIKTKNGTESVEGFVNDGLGVHKTKGSLFGSYSVTHVKSGRGIGEFEDEKLAKKTVVELQRSGIDWNTEDLTKLPGINNKMKGVMKTIEQVKTSDLRTKSARNNAIRLEKLKARQSQLDADLEKEKQEKIKAQQQAEIEKQQRLEKENAERERQTKAMQELDSRKNQSYVSPRVGIALNSIESDLNPDTWRSKISDAEEKLQKHKTIMETRGSRKYGGLSIVEEKRTKEQLKTAKTRLEAVDRFLEQDNIETVPGFLEMPIQTLLTNGRSGDEVKTLIESTHKKYKKKQPKKNDFNSHQLLAQFGGGSLRRRKTKQSTCCCESPNPLRRRKSKQTAKPRRRGNKYA